MSEPASDDGASPVGDGAAEALRRGRERAPEAADLLNALAHLAERPVPVSALRSAAPEVPGEYGEALDPGEAERVLSSLEAAGALKRTAAGVHLPGPVASTLRRELVSPVAAGAAEAAAGFLEQWREQLEAGGGGADSDWDRLAAHAVALTRRTAEAGRPPDRALRVGTRAAGRLEDRSRPRDAARLLADLGAAAEPPGPREPFLLAALEDQRAALLAELGREEAAAEAARRAVRRAEEVCGPADPRLAVLLHNAGGALKRLGRLEAAAALYDRAFGLLEEHHGGGTPLELQLCLDLSDVLLAAGDSRRAAEVAGRAVALGRERLGRYHPETAAAVSNLGRAFRAEGELGRARSCFEQAIEILERVYDPAHPALGPDLGNLGATLEEQGEIARARRVHERALEVFREAYGDEHRLARAAREHLDGL